MVALPIAEFVLTRFRRKSHGFWQNKERMHRIVAIAKADIRCTRPHEARIGVPNLPLFCH